ncbi:unnamed protein product [Mycena citricolor]|uniref:RCC1/BLIP-II n=1 Tax=Mycena citricolor TaxID=2018698 RepID=A0AAD2Q255_9AGAR|nr:unnamed protein product [Mycena citricolor]
MTTIEMLPVELLIDHLVPFFDVQSILRLACTNKFFANLCSDEVFWQRKLQEDFNFSGADTARVSGWQFIYRGLYNPKVFVWGEYTRGRLGLGDKIPKHNRSAGGVPFPTELKIPGVRIVSLVAGGMSFHALDSEGHIFVWGTLDGTTMTLNSDGYSQAGKTAPKPLRLELPSYITQISCGRLHASALSSTGQVWTFVNWGRPFVLASQHITNDSRPVQVECGWGFSSLLTRSNEVFVWWPRSGSMEQETDAKFAEMDDQRQFAARALPDGVIPCVTWELKVDPYRLPPIPSLPRMTETGEEVDGEPKIIKIAGMDANLIALTNHGHVLMFSGLSDEDTVASGRWSYLPNFSELDRVQSVPPFSTDVAPPRTMKITHISANFERFFAYSTGPSSVVLMGNTDATGESIPYIEAALVDKSVISVLVGDWHFAALTSSGKLFTWGAYSNGALGLGDPTQLPAGSPGGFATEAQRLNAIEREAGSPPDTTVPTPVRFDHARKSPKERFCFLACAAGWHTGALAIDLEADDDDELEQEEIQPERRQIFHRRGRGLPLHGPDFPNLPFGGGIFRVGFAGRGASRGGRAM